MGKTLRKYCLCFSKSKSEEMKGFSIILLGFSNSGKTEIGHKIIGKTRRDLASTNGVRKFTKGNRRILWNITEIGGSTDMQKLWHYYFVKTMAVIYTIDLSDLDNISLAFEKLEELLQNIYIQAKPILVVLTKGDLVLDENISISDIEEFYDLETLANRFKCPMLIEECNFIYDDRFDTAVQWLGGIIENNYKLLKNRIKFDSNVQNLSLNDYGKMWLQRPNSAPPLRNKNKLPVRSRIVLANKTNNINSSNENRSSKTTSRYKYEDNENNLIIGSQQKYINGNINNIQEVFGHKVEQKFFKNKVSDVNNLKNDLLNHHIQNKENRLC